MTYFRIIFLYLFAVIISLTGPEKSFAGYDYIDINSPFLRKIPIAVPLFKVKAESVSGSDRQMSGRAADMLSGMLDFTGYFKMLDRESFLEDTFKAETAVQNIDFHNWTAVGAELLVTGEVQIRGNVFEIELRLFDTIKSNQLIGKKYTTGVNDLRDVMRRFSGEIVYYLTGNRGVFDSRIAFVSNGTGNKEIYICEFDGINTRPFTRNKAITLFPAWSSDGKWIAFTSYVKGKPDLYISNVNDGSTSVVSNKGINITPAWVPGKFELAATLSYSGDQDIYLVTGSGKVIKKLTNERGSDVSPSWSPDGKKMAFVSSRTGTPQIYVLDIDSGNAERLTFNGRYNTQPSWSPKGDKIAYAGMNGGRHNIYVIGFDGKDPVQLTRNGGDNESPSWSPDGSLIAFSSTREGPSRIYVMTAYGTDQRRLLAISGEQTSPKWSP
ncbi:MAG: Tol-Pal system beta propeller repeat protein TolB [Desulfobacteraceae bacterium]|nr:MAG: Tol-Pal system beta propeller repeat protein TolB [Desulfobacteraceae bacterium]